MDRALHAAVGRLSHGVSPIVLARAYVDWLVHLGLSPGKQAQLVDKAARKALRFAIYAARAAGDPSTPPCIQPLPQDHRFDHPGWRQPPFNLIHQGFLLMLSELRRLGADTQLSRVHLTRMKYASSS
jgi:polyhydroxyalkanoate synthase